MGELERTRGDPVRGRFCCCEEEDDEAGRSEELHWDEEVTPPSMLRPVPTPTPAPAPAPVDDDDPANKLLLLLLLKLRLFVVVVVVIIGAGGREGLDGRFPTLEGLFPRATLVPAVFNPGCVALCWVWY